MNDFCPGIKNSASNGIEHYMIAHFKIKLNSLEKTRDLRISKNEYTISIAKFEP